MMMNSLRSNYKQPGNDHNDKRQKRANAVTDGRKDRRGRSFASRRNLVDCEEMEEPNDDPPNMATTVNNTENQPQQQQPQTDNKQTSMKLRLLKWKEEKEKQKQKELQLKARSRPPFKAGIVHHEKLPLAALPPVPAVSDKISSKIDSGASSGAFTFTGVQGRKFHAFKPTLKATLTNTPGTAQAMPASKKKNAALPSAMKQSSVRFAVDNKPQPQSNKENKPNVPKTTGSAAKPASKIPSNTKQVPPTVTTRSERATRANRALKMASPVTPENNVEALVTPEAESLEEAVPEVESSEKTAPEVESSEKTPAPNSTAKKTAATLKTEKKTPSSVLKSKIPLQNPALSTEMPKKPVVTRTPVAKAKTPVKIVKTPLKQTPSKQAQEEEHDCRYFRAILAKNIERLEAQCVHWEQEQEKAGDAVTEVANEQLLLATGMARLIIREKFAQFRGLIENCESNSEETKTTCTDLQGFWDMIYIQVEDIEKKFAELEKLKQNNWAPLEIEKKDQQAKKKVILAKPKLVVPKGRSNFRAFLAARINTNTANTESKDVPAAKVVEEKPAAATATRRSSVRTSVGTPLQKRRTSSPKINAIWSASRTAKSAGRKSFTQENGRADSPMRGIQNAAATPPKGTPIPKSGRRKSSTATPLQSILKNPVPLATPQSAYAKKMVVFSVPEEPEDDVLKTPIPPVKHTYSNHQSSPMTYTEKDDEFDALFYSAHGSTPTTPSTPAGDKEVNLNESYTIEEPRTTKPPTPYVQRKGRTSARFVPYTTEQEENDSDMDMDSDSEITAPVAEKSAGNDLLGEAVAVSPVKNQFSKLSVTTSDQNVSLLYTPPTTVKQNMDCSIDLNNSSATVKSTSVKKGRRSSRIPVRVLNDETNLLTPATNGSNLNASKRSSIGADLISWDSPAENSRVRRSTRIRKPTLSPYK